MTKIGGDVRPLRVAIIGAGPAGFYAAEHLYKQRDLVVEVDMYDRLPTPYGLVRNGVAPDHQKIKSVTKVFERVAQRPGFRFFGYVELGSDISVDDLRRFYHQIVYTTGAQTDRNLNIPGINLANSHAATEFVAWYNGHPDYRACHFDLSQEHVAVVGIGNVAVDVCRILCRTPSELARSDIADYALEALRNSNVRVVHMLGRRGPAQGAFTTPELKELGELEDADVIVYPEEAKLDELSKSSMADADRGTMRKVELIQEFAERELTGKSRRLHLRFLVSPVELSGDGRVESMKLVKNELYATEAGTLRPRPVDDYEEIPVGLVFRSIGYQGVRLPGVPFNENWGVILNEEGRVLDPETKLPLVGEYTAGWIKRGPTGVIGTNKPDAAETVDHMMEDLEQNLVLDPEEPTAEAVEELVRRRKPEYFTFEDWMYLDELEVQRGKKLGRPRLKFTRIEDMLAARDAQ
jgi:ferredoxin--NADP+ reductase